MSERIRTLSLYLSLLLSTTCLLISAVTAYAQTEPQQGAINTTRSNIKNTSRTGVGRFDPILIDLGDESGKKIDSRKLVDADGDGKLSEVEGKFGFRALPAGKYVLVITTASATEAGANRTAAPASDTAGAMAPVKISVTVDGAKGGALKKELAMGSAQDGANSSRTDLSGQISAVNEPLSARTYRPGRPVYGNITFESDGRAEIKGVVRHEAMMASIQNTR